MCGWRCDLGNCGFAGSAWLFFFKFFKFFFVVVVAGILHISLALL